MDGASGLANTGPMPTTAPRKPMHCPLRRLRRVRCVPMKNALDSATIELPCPHCGHKLSQTIGQLKTTKHLNCPSCGKGFDLDASHMRREITKVEKSLAKTLGALGRIGK